MKKSILLFILVLCVFIVSCGTKSTESVNNETEKDSNNSISDNTALEDLIKDSRWILYCQDEDHQYQISKTKDSNGMEVARFMYYGPDHTYTSDFLVEKYDEAIDICREVNAVPYNPKNHADENGKIIETPYSPRVELDSTTLDIDDYSKFTAFFSKLVEDSNFEEPTEQSGFVIEGDEEGIFGTPGQDSSSSEDYSTED